jgi:excisionase family DNA binding protein
MIVHIQRRKMTQQTLLSIPDFAAALGVTIACIRRWLLERKIACVKIGRLVRIPADELDRIVAEGYRPAKPRRAN